MTNSATITYAFATSGNAGRLRHQARYTSAFNPSNPSGRPHKNLCGRPFGRLLGDAEAAELRDCTGCLKARTKADAQDAWDAQLAEAAKAPYVEAGRCTPYAGGEVHEMQHDAEDGRPQHVFPLCRTGAMTNSGTKYRKVAPDAPLTCDNCVANKERRDAHRARYAPAAQEPAAPATETDPAVTVIETLPGKIEVSTEADRDGIVFITRHGRDLGTVRDEGDWSKTRGRYVAWTSAGAERTDGLLDFFHTQAEAVQAILAAHPAAAPTHGLTEPQARAYRILAAGDGWTTKGRDITRAAFAGLVEQGLAIFTADSPAWWGGRLLTASPTVPARLADPVVAFAEAIADADTETAQETTGTLFPTPTRTVAAEVARPATLHVSLDEAAPTCVHGFSEAPDDHTNPVKACDRKGGGDTFGAFNEEGAAELFDCPVEAANEARRLTAETDVPHHWAPSCPTHTEQAASTCEDCNTDDEPAADEEETEAMTRTGQTDDHLYVEVHTALAFPGYREDRYILWSAGRADAVQYVAVPHDTGIHRNLVFAALGLAPLAPLDYVAALSMERGRVERIQPADFPAARELRAYFADETTAWTVIGDLLNDHLAKLSHNDQVAALPQLNPHRRPVLREGDAYPIGWTFRVGYGDDATYSAVTRSGDTDGLTGYPTREDAEAALRSGGPVPAFKAGDKVVCADGRIRTVTGMSYYAGEPARVVVEGGAQWNADDCTRANTEDVEAARQAVNAASRRVTSDPDATNPEWREALDQLGTSLDLLRTIDPITRAALAEQGTPVEGTIVSHTGTTRGCMPEDADDSDVQAALAVLDNLRCVQLTAEGPAAAETFGFMVKPLGHGRVAVHWVYAQDITGPQGSRFDVELGIAEERFSKAGWTTRQTEEPFLLVWDPAHHETVTNRTGNTALALSCPPAPADGPTTPVVSDTDDARDQVIGAYPDAHACEAVHDEDGVLQGFTFKTGKLHASRYGWVTTAGTYGKSLERYRGQAAAMLPAQVADDRRAAERTTARAAHNSAAQPLRQAMESARRGYPSALRFVACESADGQLLAVTFQTVAGPSARYGWVYPDGRLAPATEAYRSEIEQLLRDEHERPARQARPALPRRPKAIAQDLEELEALRGLLGQLRVIAQHGDLGDVRAALAEYDEDTVQA